MKSEMPEWLKDEMPTDQYEKVRKSIRSVDEWKEKEGNLIKVEADKFKLACQAIRKDTAEKLAVPLADDVVFIHTLTTQHLPFSLLGEVIEISEDKDLDDSEQNKLIKNIMVKWKKGLYQEVLSKTFNRQKYVFT